MFGIFAIILAIGFSAFTAPKQSVDKAVDTYWFLTQDDGTPINTSSIPPTTNPASECDNTDLTRFCVKEFSSYTGSGPYAPAGTLLSVIKKTAE